MGGLSLVPLDQRGFYPEGYRDVFDVADRPWPKHVEVDDHHGIADAYVVPSGVCVWALIGHLRGVQSLEQTQQDYQITREEMEAAVLFYVTYHEFIDAVILLNDFISPKGNAL